MLHYLCWTTALMRLGLVWALSFVFLFGDFFLIGHPHLGYFLFSAEVLLCFRPSDFPADLEILIHPEPPHLSPGMHSVFILRKSGSYRSEKWLHLITMIYLRISEGQRESIASRERCFLELLYLRMRKLHWPTTSKYFCHILVLSLCVWGWKEAALQFCCCHILCFMFSFV